MATEEVRALSIATDHVLNALAEYDAALQAGVVAYFGDVLESDSADDVRTALALLSRLAQRKLTQLRGGAGRADDAHQKELADDPGKREARDVELSKSMAAVQDFKASVADQFGHAGLALYNLTPALTQARSIVG